MSNFTFPKPGERHNKSAAVVPYRELAHVLTMAARDIADVECPLTDPDCSWCLAAREAWVQTFYLLDWKHKEAVITTLAYSNTPLPDDV